MNFLKLDYQRRTPRSVEWLAIAIGVMIVLAGVAVRTGILK
jgi:hypothetical protein